MNLSTAALLVIGLAAIAIVLVVRFEKYCLQDLGHTSDDQLLYLSRSAWTMLIMFWIPFGGIAYFYFGKAR